MFCKQGVAITILNDDNGAELALLVVVCDESLYGLPLHKRWAVCSPFSVMFVFPKSKSSKRHNISPFTH